MSEVIDYKACEKCGGWCCNHSFTPVETKTLTPALIEYYEAVSTDIRVVGDLTLYVLYSPCPHGHNGFCDLGDDRPHICKTFPKNNTAEWAEFCLIMQKGEK